MARVRSGRGGVTTLPINRTVVTVPAARPSITGLSMTSPTNVSLMGQGIRKGRAKNKVGMWGSLSMTYKTAATIDKSWDATVSTHGTV